MNRLNLVERASDVRQAQEFNNLRQLANTAPPASTGSLNRWCRERLLGKFSKLESGAITVDEGNRSWQLGTPQSGELTAKIFVNDPNFYSRIMFGATIGSAESFIDGDWDTDDLTAVIRIFIQNMPQMVRLEKTWARFKNSLHWMAHLRRKNTLEGSRKNIEDHYDLGNDFYKLFLDPTMNYSSGIFPDASASMYEASIRKMDRIGTKLRLKPTDHLLEIGTGWGGLAIHLAKKFGCQITTTTISRQQYKYARKQVAEQGLRDQVHVVLSDYRDLKGKFDKIVSIEMIEAVGHEFYDQYFAKCAEMLADDGLMLIQSITMSQQNYQHHIRNIDFIRRYVFPGGCLPSVVALAQSVGSVTNMRMAHLEDITEHYVTTLQDWRHRFHDAIEEVRSLGYDQKFIRLWHFYLCYCEAAFAERRVHNVQLLFAQPGSDVDPANEFAKFEESSAGQLRRNSAAAQSRFGHNNRTIAEPVR